VESHCHRIHHNSIPRELRSPTKVYIFDIEKVPRVEQTYSLDDFPLDQDNTATEDVGHSVILMTIPFATSYA
jgi:hypothetical protein